MNLKLSEAKLEEDEYIRIKRIAYNYYEKYKNLDKKMRREFLNSLPELDLPIKTLIVKNTLLFPDTVSLLKMPKGKLLGHLLKLSQQIDGVENINVSAKQLEYLLQNPQKLVAEGKLSVMEELNYPKECISDKEYLILKKEALAHHNNMFELQLIEKDRLVEKCLEKNSYQTKIQLATLLIPNDKLFMEELEHNSMEQLSGKYRVPVELIEFKQQEYINQDTKKILEQGKLPTNVQNRLWFSSNFDDGVVDILWDQSFYRNVENDIIGKINDNLANMYSSKHLIK